MIIVIDAETAFDKNPTPIFDKNLQQTRTRREFLQSDKGHLQKICSYVLRNSKGEMPPP